MNWGSNTPAGKTMHSSLRAAIRKLPPSTELKDREFNPLLRLGIALGIADHTTDSKTTILRRLSDFKNGLHLSQFTISHLWNLCSSFGIHLSPDIKSREQLANLLHSYTDRIQQIHAARLTAWLQQDAKAQPPSNVSATTSHQTGTNRQPTASSSTKTPSADQLNLVDSVIYSLEKLGFNGRRNSHKADQNNLQRNTLNTTKLLPKTRATKERSVQPVIASSNHYTSDIVASADPFAPTRDTFSFGAFTTNTEAFRPVAKERILQKHPFPYLWTPNPHQPVAGSADLDHPSIPVPDPLFSNKSPPDLHSVDPSTHPANINPMADDHIWNSFVLSRGAQVTDWSQRTPRRVNGNSIDLVSPHTTSHPTIDHQSVLSPTYSTYTEGGGSTQIHTVPNGDSENDHDVSFAQSLGNEESNAAPIAIPSINRTPLGISQALTDLTTSIDWQSVIDQAFDTPQECPYCHDTNCCHIGLIGPQEVVQVLKSYTSSLAVTLSDIFLHVDTYQLNRDDGHGDNFWVHTAHPDGAAGTYDVNLSGDTAVGHDHTNQHAENTYDETLEWPDLYEA